MLSPIPPASVASLRQLALKMEKILLTALEGYGNTFVEPKVELGARFGHLVRKCLQHHDGECIVYLTAIFNSSLP